MSSPTDGHRPSIDIDSYLETGQRYEQAGAHERALHAYRAVLGAASAPRVRAQAYLRMSRVHRELAAWDDALVAAREAIRTAEELRDDDLVAEAMNAEVGVHQLRGDFEQGHAVAGRALRRARAPRTRGMLLQNRGAMAARSGDLGLAEEFFSESITAFREAGYARGLASALINGSAAALDAGNPERALALAQEASEVALKGQSFDMVMVALQNQGEALVCLDRLDEAESMLGGTLGHFASTGNALRQAECLEILAGLHARRSDGRGTAVRCLERASALARTVGDRVLTERLASRLAALGAAPAPSGAE
jgi:tetratricopeptide (TPR) repeat protein